MTYDDLIERLRNDHPDPLTAKAADRIEQLVRERDELEASERFNNGAILLEFEKREAAEAKLAKAAAALREMIDYYDKVNPFHPADFHDEDCDCDRCNFEYACAVLAELEKKE
jgi:hypothetical protein